MVSRFGKEIKPQTESPHFLFLMELLKGLSCEMVWASVSINGRTRSEYGTQMVLNFFSGLPNLKNDQYSDSLVFFCSLYGSA